jgi:hypothetical protein
VDDSDPHDATTGGEDYRRFTVGCFWAAPISVALWALILYVLLVLLTRARGCA